MINIFFDESTFLTVKEVESHKYEQNILIKLFLNYGPLYERLDSKERINTLNEIFCGVYDELIKNSLNNLAYIANLPAKSDICIWYSDFDTNNLISLYFICHLLLSRNTNIFIQSFPSSIYKKKQGWWSMDSGLICTMKKNIRQLTKEQITSFDNKWNEVLKTPSSLRISRNKSISHVNEDYYDEFILKAK